MKAVHLVFSCSSTYESWEAALRLIATGRLKVKRLVTHIFPLEERERAFILVERAKLSRRS